ncbi:MAG TPA: amino acid permease [Pseudonocardiaceae bacterium]|jgi:APA family basic amino acid/polyamine antiporter|nr:amino acid permease [Pseudonocardiaceae bacterium]
MAASGLWRTKSIEQSIAETDEPGSRLRKNLGALDLTVFGVAVLIGAGIFVLAAQQAGDTAGPAVSLSFVLAAIACGFAVLCYAELASTVPVAGSAYTYSYATFGEFIAWIIGWDLVLEFSVGGAVLAKSWSAYLEDAVGGAIATTIEVGGIAIDWAAVLIVGILTVVLAVGIKLSSRVSQVITAIKIAVVLLVIVVGIGFIQLSNYTPFIPPARPGESSGGSEQSLFSLLSGAEGSTYGVFGVLAAASVVFFAFIGFDIVATTAEEARNPQRDMPRAIIGSLVIVTVLYVAVALVITGMQPYTALTTSPDGDTATLATAFANVGLPWIAGIIALGALAGLTTVAMILMLGQIRVLFAMSRDGLFPRALARTGSRGTPVRATLVVGAVVGVVAALFPIIRLEQMVNIGALFAFVLVSAGVVVLRRTRPDLPRGFRTPLVPLVPLLAILSCLWLMLNLSVGTWIRFLIWLAIGLVIYFAYGARKSRLRQGDRLGV